MRLTLIGCIVVLSGACAAQTPTKDRNTFIVEAMTSQRDRAQADAAACYADASVMISKLQAEIAELKAPKKDEPPKRDPGVAMPDIPSPAVK